MKMEMETLGNIIMVIMGIIAIFMTIWFLASWADIVLNHLHQSWNLFEIMAEIYG